jgi:hypothetical protein
VGKGLVAAAVEAAEAGDETEGEVERVTIRSLDEHVAVGGKNFSESRSSHPIRRPSEH